MDQKISASTFQKHLKSLQDHLKESDGALLISGKEEGSLKPKTKNMFVWLTGYDMIETILAVTKKSVIFLASSKKLQMFDEMKPLCKNVSFFLLMKAATNNQDNFQKIQEKMISDSGKDNPKVYHLSKEKQVGQLNDEWQEFQKTSQINFVEGLNFFSTVLSFKDDEERKSIKTGSMLTNYFFKKLDKIVVDAIDQSTKVKHIDISNRLENLIDSPGEKAKIQTEFKLKEDAYDFSYPPLVQSGGEYSLLPSAISNSKLLSSDVVILSCGTQVNAYNTTVARTIFINPTDMQKKVYLHLLEVHQLVCDSLKAGSRINEIYKMAQELWNTKKTDLDLPDCPQVLGYGIGLDFREQVLSINEKNNRKIEPNQTFAVTVGVENLQDAPDKQKYAILITDTVIADLKPDIATAKISKLFKNVSYQMEELEAETTKRDPVNQKDHLPRTKARNLQLQMQRENDNLRKAHQSELVIKKQQELEERYENNGFVKEGTQLKNLELAKLQCYRQPENMPGKRGAITIDAMKQAILLPFEGGHTPFHISCIKNVNKIDEGRNGQSLRINFFTTETTVPGIVFPEINGKQIQIKEIQVRCGKFTKLNEIITSIKQLQKKFKTEQERINMVEINEKFLPNTTGRKPVFRDLKIRPAMTAGKGSGILEVHTNGFRYIHNHKEHIEIVFKNVKHFIYQSPEQEIIAAIHLNLVTPLLVGKKKTQDVQFYTEVGGAVDQVDGKKRYNRTDEDEMEEEERQKQQRKKTNREFEAFIKSVEEMSKGYNIQFEKPYRDLGFEGNYNRSRLFLQPTMRTLMNVIESPFFVLSIQEVEIACLERVTPGIKSFDLVFVFKNYERPVMRIESIDQKDQEGVKNWLDKMNILFFEVVQNLVWKNVLATIQKDIQGFIEDGGWATVLGDSDGEDESGNEFPEDESEFKPDGDVDDDDYSGDDDGEDDDEDDYDDDDEEEEDVIDFDKLSEENSDEDSEEESEKPKQKQKRNPIKKK